MEPGIVHVIAPDDRTEVTEPPAPGARRETAFASDDGYWVGVVTTEPDLHTGWHHHGSYDTFAYVVSGTARLEYGPGGRDAVEAGPGAFAHIPKGVVHREVNPGGEENTIILLRIGSGVPIIPADGPEPA